MLQATNWIHKRLSNVKNIFFPKELTWQKERKKGEKKSEPALWSLKHIWRSSTVIVHYNSDVDGFFHTNHFFLNAHSVNSVLIITDQVPIFRTSSVFEIHGRHILFVLTSMPIWGGTVQSWLSEAGSRSGDVHVMNWSMFLLKA